MKLCLKCGLSFALPEWQCPVCGFAPRQEHGCVLFAPALADENDDYNPELFSRYAVIASTHFWFRNRSRIILDVLQQSFPDARSLLEVGCGTGSVLSEIRQAFGHLSLSGCDLYPEALAYVSQRLADVQLFQADARSVPFSEEFDVVGAFDVLEHIDEDELVLGQLHRACKPGGGIIITVPQHPFLWSRVDEYARHKRRYTRRELVEKATKAGFRVERVTSFVSLLFPLMILSRIRQRRPAATGDGMDEAFKISEPLNRLLGTILSLERTIIRMGVSFPFGGSLLMVGRKEIGNSPATPFNNLGP